MENDRHRGHRNVLLAALVLVLVFLSSFGAYAYASSQSPGTVATSTVTATNTVTVTQTGTVTDTTTVTSVGTSTTTETLTSDQTVTRTTTETVIGVPTTAGDWLTYHGNTTRDGYDSSVPTLSSLSTAWKTEVDGPVYAEPVSFNGSVFIATENDTVYSLSASTGKVQWSLQVGTAARSTVAPYACNGGLPSITPIIGVTSTPVIDPSTATIYVVSLNAGVGFTLFAINTGTGQVRWSVPIQANGFAFTPQEQRGALAMANGFIYIPFGSYSWNCGSPHGWLFAIAADDNGTQYSYMVPSPNEADIWTPEGVSVGSSGDIYAVTGNTYYNSTFTYADSVLEFTPQLKLVAYFSPSNWAFLGPADLDQDTTGATLLPGNLVFSIGKSGVGFLLNETDLGGIGGQLFTATVCASGAWGSTMYANGVIYVPCANGLYALSLHGGVHPTFTSLWNFTGFFVGPPIETAGAVWTVSIANGTLFALNPQTGSVMAKMSLGSPEEHFTTPSIGGGLVLVADNETVYGLDTK